MPEIARFLGIIISIYYNDHNPPHFHAEYGDFQITVEIESGVVNGRFPKRALRAVLEWYDLHREDLIPIPLNNFSFMLHLFGLFSR